MLDLHRSGRGTPEPTELNPKDLKTSVTPETPELTEHSISGGLSELANRSRNLGDDFIDMLEILGRAGW